MELFAWDLHFSLSSSSDKLGLNFILPEAIVANLSGHTDLFETSHKYCATTCCLAVHSEIEKILTKFELYFNKVIIDLQVGSWL